MRNKNSTTTVITYPTSGFLQSISLLTMTIVITSLSDVIFTAVKTVKVCNWLPICWLKGRLWLKSKRRSLSGFYFLLFLPETGTYLYINMAIWITLCRKRPDATFSFIICLKQLSLIKYSFIYSLFEGKYPRRDNLFLTFENCPFFTLKVKEMILS